ncbi:hypothetical protein VTI28DRAFT_7784 [Corynascus sepedonium]
MSLQHALNSSSKFSHYWFLATCPGLLDMPRGSGLDCTNLAWLNSNNIGAEMETPEGRRGHDIFQHIDRIFRASGKVEAIRQLLAAARRDDSLPMGAPLRTTPKKKRACIFTARPGTAVALASWADKHLSRKWKVVVVLSKTSASRRQQVIDNAFQDIPCGDRALSTLFIASTGVCGVGINDLHKASHLIIAELRLRETDRSAC